MVREHGDVVWVEISQQRHRHTAVDIDTPEGDRPTCRVARADDDFIALVDMSLVEKQLELFDVRSQICIGKAFAIIVTECSSVCVPCPPVFSDSVSSMIKTLFVIESRFDRIVQIY